MCRSLRRTRVGQTTAGQTKRIISRWHLCKVDFEEVSRGIAVCVICGRLSKSLGLGLCIFNFHSSRKCQLKALALSQGLFCFFLYIYTVVHNICPTVGFTLFDASFSKILKNISIQTLPLIKLPGFVLNGNAGGSVHHFSSD